MRGKQTDRKPAKDRVRITPAHAGKTLDEYHQHPDTGIHPRACGENISAKISAFSPSGSPPRMRGKPVSPPLYRERVGITPAHAGKTHATHKPIVSARDHPRACGENDPYQLPCA